MRCDQADKTNYACNRCMPPTISAVPRRMSKRNRFKSTPIDDAVSWPRERGDLGLDDDLKDKKSAKQH